MILEVSEEEEELVQVEVTVTPITVCVINR